MRENWNNFLGRGLGNGYDDELCRIIQCDEGSVMAIIYSSHGVDFVQGYCRNAMIDRWGMFCEDPFRLASDAALTCSWAEPIGRSLFLFRPTRLEIMPEREWMRQAKREKDSTD